MNDDKMDELVTKYMVTPDKDELDYFAEYIKNKSIDLEVRWEYFKKLSKVFSSTQSWQLHCNDELKTAFKLGKYDDLWGYEAKYHCDRHETVDMIRVYDKLKEDDCYITNEKLYTKEQLDILREFILTSNVRSFNYDW